MAKLGYVVVVVSGMDRSVVFYRDVLQCPAKYESPGWTEFADEGTPIALFNPDAANVTHPTGGRAPVGECHLCLVAEAPEIYEAEIGWKGVKPLTDYQARTQDFGNRLRTYTGADGLMRSYNPKNPGLEGNMMSIYTDPDGLPVWIAETPQPPEPSL
jgi:catechol 2,3-dioxygenase-like lactoylglutathione lyase family enzyme